MSRFHLLHASPLFRRALPLLLYPAIVTGASAQLGSVPISIGDQLEQTSSLARSLFAPDAILTSVTGTGGGRDEPTAPPVDLANESAAMWSYTFYAPSKSETYTVDISKVDTMYQVVLPGPLPAEGSETAVDLSKPFAQLSALPDQLATSDVYALYSATYPTLAPSQVTLGHITYIGLPEWFPKQQKQWRVDYATAEGDRLACVVAVETGETFCARTIAVTLSVPGAEGLKQGSASLTAFPNPASGRVRIEVHPRSDGSSGPARRIELFDARGSHVRDLAPVSDANGRSIVEIDTEGLAPGLYVCRASGDTWNESIGVMVGR